MTRGKVQREKLRDFSETVRVSEGEDIGEKDGDDATQRRDDRWTIYGAG